MTDLRQYLVQILTPKAGEVIIETNESDEQFVILLEPVSIGEFYGGGTILDIRKIK